MLVYTEFDIIIINMKTRFESLIDKRLINLFARNLLIKYISCQVTY